MTLELPWLLLGVRLGVDGTRGAFLGFTVLLWLLSALYAYDYVHERRRAFAAYFAATFAGNVGLVVSLDAVTFYFFFALMTFAAYGLVVHERTQEAVRAGRVYIVFAVIGEAFLLAGLILLTSAGAPSDLVIGLLIVGFGVKAGILGLHGWLPLAHPVAPTPASAVLSGAMIKAGLLGWLQFLPLGDAAFPGWGQALVALGIAAAFYGALAGVLQDDPKAVLAYSSISQMGFMTVAVGVALAAPQAASAAIGAAAFYALHHGLAKAALFLGVGVAPARRALLFAALVVPAAALAGIPFTSGATAKHLLKELLHDWPLVPTLLSLGAAGTTLLMARFLFLMYAKREGAGRAIARSTWLAAVAASAAAVLLAPLSAPTWSDVWPMLLGVALALGAMRLPARLRAWRIPPGDMLEPMARFARKALKALERLVQPAGAYSMSQYSKALQVWKPVVAWLGSLSLRGEARIRFAGPAWLLAVLVLVFLAAAS